MRSLILLLVDLGWLAAALALLVWGGILWIRQPRRWKNGLGLVAAGALLMGTRFIGSWWRIIHDLVGG